MKFERNSSYRKNKVQSVLRTSKKVLPNQEDSVERGTFSNNSLLSPGGTRKKEFKALKKRESKNNKMADSTPSPPHLIFEQGEILKCFPNIDVKLLILQMLNQKILDVFPYTKSMQNDIIAISTYNVRDTHRFNKVKYYNFIINDNDQDLKKEETLYQHLKQKNFAGEETSQKRILIKVVDRLDAKHKILNNKTMGINSRYNYEQI